MKSRQTTAWVAAFLLAFVTASSDMVQAQSTPQESVFKKEELQQLLAPVALYPDQLLSQVLMASTYPLQIVQAARWQKENAKVTGASLDTALNEKEWDPSVKSLVPFPQVIQMMSDKLEWTQKLGDAFLAQQADVMAEVQFLRAKAQEAGTLKTTKEQKVTTQASPATSTQKEIIIIEPASPQVVYVPVYNPTVVYGGWWYPLYPPYYYPPPAGAAFVSGFFWGAAIAASANYWGWSNCNWHGGDININVNRFNKINVNSKYKNTITSNKWQHNPANRGQVPYRDQKSREQYGAKSRPGPSSREARGFEPAGARAQDLSKGGPKDLPKDVKRDQPKVGARDAPRTGGADVAKRADRADARPAGGQGRAKSPAAFDVKRGTDVRAHADRGKASRQRSMAQHGGGRHSLGGGGRAGGRGGRR